MRVEVEVEADGWSAVPDVEGCVRRAVEASTDIDGGVAVLLTDDAAVRDLNARFRGKDQPTNVLSFPSAENPEGHLGDIALAYETCATEARAQGKTLDSHLTHLVIHGTLHLLGHDHAQDDEAEVMEAREREVMVRLGLSDPYPPHPLAGEEI